MEVSPKILFGQVIHKRLFPKVNAFNYGIYYILLPLSGVNAALENKYFKLNRWGLISFYYKDHGNRDGGNLELWARDILKKYKIEKADGEIFLLTMPRVFGYVFNPVSFWYCFDKNKKLRAVICEVNNTFGETHSYICAHEDQSEITRDGFIAGQKVFHVSPFLEREGRYDFRFHLEQEKMGAWIDFFDKSGQKKLVTVLSGDFKDFNENNAGRAFWRYPLITIKSILLIHWQAVKLFVKGCEYVPKPVQKADKTSPATTKKDSV